MGNIFSSTMCIIGYATLYTLFHKNKFLTEEMALKITGQKLSPHPDPPCPQIMSEVSG